MLTLLKTLCFHSLITIILVPHQPTGNGLRLSYVRNTGIRSTQWMCTGIRSALCTGRYPELRYWKLSGERERKVNRCIFFNYTNNLKRVPDLDYKHCGLLWPLKTAWSDVWAACSSIKHVFFIFSPRVVSFNIFRGPRMWNCTVLQKKKKEWKRKSETPQVYLTTPCGIPDPEGW